MHLWTVAHVCMLTLAACGGNDAALPDAPSCMAVADPHDEDGDGIYDACDNCPAAANPTQSDTGETGGMQFPDGVGDGCDPRPTAGGDDLHSFYAFASDAEASAFTGSGWTISGDAAHASGTATWTTTHPVASDGGLLVAAELSSLAFGAQGTLTITLDGDGISTGETCTLAAQMLTVAEGGGATNSVALPSPIDGGQPLRFTAWRVFVLVQNARVAQVICRVKIGGITKETMIQLTDDVVSGTYAIAASDATVDATSLSIYTGPGPKTP